MFISEKHCRKHAERRGCLDTTSVCNNQKWPIMFVPVVLASKYMTARIACDCLTKLSLKLIRTRETPYMLLLALLYGRKIYNTYNYIYTHVLVQLASTGLDLVPLHPKGALLG